MRVLLVIPKHPFHADAYFFGIGSISAVLQRAGHETRVLTVYPGCAEDFARVLADYEPGLVGVHIATDAFPIACEAIAVAGELDVPVVVGGPHTNAAPEEILREPGIRWVCKGEGEGPMLDLAERLERGEPAGDIANLVFMDGARMVTNAMRPLIECLDELPLVDKSFRRYVPIEDETWRRLLGIWGQPVGYGDDFMMSRGCPYACAYCTQYGHFEGLGERIRLRSVDSFLDEIEAAMAINPLDFVFLHDDILAAVPAWFSEFAPRYRERIGLPFSCNLRPDHVPDELIVQHKQAGAFLVSIGVESGSDHIRRDVLGRPVSREAIIDVFRKCREVGIHTTAYVMVGVPGETEQTMRETYELCREIQPDIVHASIFNPYPGTPLYDVCRKHGWISDRPRMGTFFEPSALDLPGLSVELINEYQELLGTTAVYLSTPSIRYSGAVGVTTDASTKETVGKRASDGS